MVDHLNEFMILSRKRGDNGSYRRAALLKRRGANIIFNQLCREWTSRFSWSAVGDASSIPAERIEIILLQSGMCGFAKITSADIRRASGLEISDGTNSAWKILSASGGGAVNFDGYPVTLYLSDQQGRSYGHYLVHANDGLTLPTETRECVLLQDSVHGLPPLQTVLYYAEKLSVIETAINAAIRNINGTTIITAPPEAETQIRKQQKAAEMGVPYLVRYDTGFRDDVKIMSSPAMPEVLKTLYESYNKIHSDYLQTIGIRANNEIDKKSGVTPLEIVQSRQNVDIILNDAMNCRKDAIKKLESMGLSGLSVDFSNFTSQTVDYDAQGRPISQTDSEITSAGGQKNEHE